MKYPHSVNIKRKTNVDLGHGSFSGTYTVVSTGVSAFIQDKEIIDIIRAGRKINSTAYDCYFKTWTDVLGDDRIEFESQDYAIISKQQWVNRYVLCHLELIIP